MILHSFPKPNRTTKSHRATAGSTSFLRIACAFAICIALLVSRVAMGQCCGGGGGGGGSPDPLICPLVQVCYWWTLGTGFDRDPTGDPTVKITFEEDSSEAGSTPRLPLEMPATPTGEGILYVKPGTTLNGSFLNINGLDAHVFFQQCGEVCDIVPPSPDTYTVPACLDGGEEGEGNSDLDDNEGPSGPGGSGSGVGDDGDAKPYHFTLGLGSLSDGSPAGRIDFRPMDLSASSVVALPLVVRLDSTIINTLAASNEGTLVLPEVIVTIANIQANSMNIGFTLTCTKPGQTVPFVTWRFTRTASTSLAKMLVEKLVDGVVASSERVTKHPNGWDLEKGPKYTADGWAMIIKQRNGIGGNPNSFTRTLSSLFDLTQGSPVPLTTLLQSTAWTKVGGNVTVRTVGDLTTWFTYDGTDQVTSSIRSDGKWKKYRGIQYGGFTWKMTQSPTRDLAPGAADPMPYDLNSGSVVLSRFDAASQKSYRSVFEDGQLLRTSESGTATRSMDIGWGEISFDTRYTESNGVQSPEK